MKIQNLLVYREGGVFEKGDLCFENGVITRASSSVVQDGEGLYAIPGLVDLHFHGCVGYDFCDGSAKALDAIAEYQLQHGVTAITPASMTLPEEQLANIFEIAAAYTGTNGAMLCGIDMEGPFFSYDKRGAQNPAYLKEPDIAMFERLQEKAAGLIQIACVAPELPGAMEWIAAVSRNTKVSIAHTTSDYNTAMRAFYAGASHVTHLYNAMPPLGHRMPGVIGAAADSGAAVELICDGVHLHPSVVRATYKLFGQDHICLISDSMMATGLEDGEYTLGGQPVTVKGNRATLTDGTIAGSATNLFDCMKKAVLFGIPLTAAVQMATENPAKEIGEYHRMGSLTIGKLANIVLCDSALNIKQVFLQGKPVL